MGGFLGLALIGPAVLRNAAVSSAAVGFIFTALVLAAGWLIGLWALFVLLTAVHFWLGVRVFILIVMIPALLYGWGKASGRLG